MKSQNESNGEPLSWVLPAVVLAAAFLVCADAYAQSALVRVQCDEADKGAEVSINGKFKGECPIDVGVPAGTVKLRVVKKVNATHERVFEQEFRLGDGVVKRVEAVFPGAQADAQPGRPGTLTPAPQSVVSLPSTSASASAAQPVKDCDVCPEIVVIPAGSYDMGGAKRITLSRPFAVGKTEVTFAQWDACVAEGGCKYRPDDRGWGRGKQPVINVSWDDAKQYVAWLARKTAKSYRLLTDAEWEYAARAGSTSAYYWGDSDSDICRYASVDNGNDGCGADRPSPVGSRLPNAFGLYDMLGNVWEWVEDCNNTEIDGVPSDGSARTTGSCWARVLRGGSWSEKPAAARSSIRSGLPKDYRNFGSSFRVAKTL